MTKIHGGQVLARALRSAGVDTAFTLTGGHVVAILDGLVQEGIRVVDLRHEQAVVHAAEAYARLTGQLGLAVVTAGPGVTDTVTGVANAMHSDTPLLVLAGRHFIRQELKGGLQEMDHPRLMSAITKWAATAWQPERLADYVSTAARHAFAGRGGPVFLDVPMEVQFDMVDESGLRWPAMPERGQVGGVDSGILEHMVDLLMRADHPVIFASAIGPGSNRLQELAEVLDSPIFLSGRARGSVAHGHPLLGAHTRSQVMAEADLVLALGVDWDFRTGYGERLSPPTKVIQVDRDQSKLGLNRLPTVGAVADPIRVVDQLLDHAGRIAPAQARSWTAGFSAGEAAAAQSIRTAAMSAAESPVDPIRFAIEVGDFFGPASIVAVDGGDIVSTTARWLQVSSPGHVLDPGPFGTLGTGAPYAIAARLAFPQSIVGIVFGDGAFGFNGFEYDSLVRHQLPVVGVLGNDGVWSNVKTFHRAFFPDRVVAADLGRRPYHAVVESLGGFGLEVESASEMRPALEKARASGQPALVNVILAETMRESSTYSV